MHDFVTQAISDLAADPELCPVFAPLAWAYQTESLGREDRNALLALSRKYWDEFKAINSDDDEPADVL